MKESDIERHMQRNFGYRFQGTSSVLREHRRACNECLVHCGRNRVTASVAATRTRIDEAYGTRETSVRSVLAVSIFQGESSGESRTR